VSNRIWIIAGAVIGISILAFVLLNSNSGNDITAIAKPASDSDAKQIYEQANTLKADRNLLEAKNLYQQLITEHPDFGQIETVQSELNQINMDLIFSNTPTPQTVIHEVAAGDTLGKIAKQYGTTIDLIKRSNNLKSDIVRLGQKLRIWTGQFNIFVDKSQNILMLKSNDEVIKVYSVSTGKDNSTPVGSFKITSKLIDPVWFHQGVVVPPESPENVLGSRWLGFDMPGYGIHGTVDPDAIGKQVTAGCVRMKNADVEEIYSIIPMGTEVMIVD